MSDVLVTKSDITCLRIEFVGYSVIRSIESLIRVRPSNLP